MCYDSHLTVAFALGMTLRQYLRKVTYREHLVHVRWLRDQWDRPSRSDHYLMQIGFFCARQGVKNPKSVKFEHMRMKFGSGSKRKKGPLSPAERERIISASKMSWIGRVTTEKMSVVVQQATPTTPAPE